MAPLQLCTISSRGYLPFARALAGSVRRYQPETTFRVLLADDLAHEVDGSAEPFEAVWNEDLGIDQAELHRMYLIHGPSFIAAIKPFYLEWVVEQTGAPTLYLDSDIRLYGSLGDLGEIIEQHGVLLSPHSLTPYPVDGCLPDDTLILSAGTFNAGMIGVSERGLPMMRFLQSRLRRECVVDTARMRVNEQRWLDFTPSYSPCHVLRDQGVNVAYWNLHERPLERVGGQLRAGSAPLRAFHFSGHDLAEPELVTRHTAGRGRVVFEGNPLLVELYADFRSAVLDAGWRPDVRGPVAYDELPGRIPVDETLRSLYRASVVGSESQGLDLPPDGYDLGQRPLFRAWAELAFHAVRQPVPAWAQGGAGSSHLARVPPGSDAASTPQPAVAQPQPSRADDAGELVRQLARSTSAALANLNERLTDLECRLGAPVSAGAGR